MKPQKQILGQKGEQHAVDYLIKKGHQIVTRNYRSGKSEIDIICQKDNTLVFCEVKSFQSKPIDAVEFRIDKKKQQQIITGAYGFLKDYPQYEGMDIRFDVMILNFLNYPVSITHHQAAFWLEEPF